MSDFEIEVKGRKIDLTGINDNDYVSLTDIARFKNAEEPKDVVKNWMRLRGTIEYLGLWEQINNPNFKGVEFDAFKQESGHNYFVLTPEKWITKTNAIGIKTKRGKYHSGTYAHRDIALEFASWISPEIKLYIIKEFQRLKEEELKQLDWTEKRFLSKANYRIHTNAIKEKLISPDIAKDKERWIYASEADLLNLALFGMTAKEWRSQNPNKKGNIRDYASINELVILSNLECFNSELLRIDASKEERLIFLIGIANKQKKILSNNIEQLENKGE